jgi:hypothetical protein
MAKNFLKKEEVTLINGGYLSNEKTKQPIDNKDFVKAQQHAEYVVTFAEMAKDKDFKGKEAYSLEAFKQEVFNKVNQRDIKKHIALPKKPEGTLTEKLKEEALNFIDFDKGVEKAEKINIFLTQFDTISEFEEFGLFFKQGIVKLNRIYTMKEIVKAVKSVIDLL